MVQKGQRCPLYSKLNNSNDMNEIPVTCNKDCGGGCPLIALVEDGELKRLKNSPHKSKYMFGCSRGFEMTKVLNDPKRLRSPLLQTGKRGSDQFKEISWDEALDRIASKLQYLKDHYGNSALLPLGGSGSCRGSLHHTGKLNKRFFNLFGGYVETHGNYSSGAYTFTKPFVVGDAWTGIDPATLEHSSLIILWGLNIDDNRYGSEFSGWLRELSKKGTPVVCIEPRVSNSVKKLSAEWIPVFPGTDAVLMTALLYIFIKNNRVNLEFLRKYTAGFEALEMYILGKNDQQPKTPEWANAICGTPIESIYRLADLYINAKPAALLPGLSIQRTIGGEEAVRLSFVLQAVTGNIGKLGGSSGGSIWGSTLPEPQVGKMTVPVSNPITLPSFPVYQWPDAVLGGKSGGYPSDIHCIYNVGGNYLVQGSDTRKSIKAFESVDFVVTHDYMLTTTARYSDIVLPVTTFLEREDIISTGNNILLYSHKAVEPIDTVKNDYDIFSELSEKLGFSKLFTENRKKEDWLRFFLEQSDIPDIEKFKQTGIYFGENQSRIGMSDFLHDPIQYPLSTPSGKIEICSEAYAKTGFPAYPNARYLGFDSEYPLRLITPKSKFRTHSQNHKGETQTLWIHPKDADSSGIAQSKSAIVKTSVGILKTNIRITDEIMEGVVLLFEGIWPFYNDIDIDEGGCPNTVTSTDPTLPSECSRTHSINVSVSAEFSNTDSQSPLQ